MLAALDELENGTLTATLLPVPDREPWQYFHLGDLSVLLYPDEQAYWIAEVGSQRQIERLFRTL